MVVPTPARTKSDTDSLICGWALRSSAGALCAQCGSTPRTTYQLRQLTLAGWTDVAGVQWCLPCWSAHSARSHLAPTTRTLD